MRLRLIAARESRGWSQQYVANTLKKDRSSYTHYERGTCDIPGNVLQRLSDLFDVPMSELLANTITDTTPVGVEDD